MRQSYLYFKYKTFSNAPKRRRRYLDDEEEDSSPSYSTSVQPIIGSSREESPGDDADEGRQLIDHSAFVDAAGNEQEGEEYEEPDVNPDGFSDDGHPLPQHPVYTVDEDSETHSISDGSGQSAAVVIPIAVDPPPPPSPKMTAKKNTHQRLGADVNNNENAKQCRKKSVFYILQNMCILNYKLYIEKRF